MVGRKTQSTDVMRSAQDSDMRSPAFPTVQRLFNMQAMSRPSTQFWSKYVTFVPLSGRTEHNDKRA